MRDKKSIFLFTAPPSRSEITLDRYLSKRFQMRLTRPPTRDSKTRKDRVNLTFLLKEAARGVISPIKMRDRPPTISFSPTFSGKKTTPTADKAPRVADKISRFVVVFVFEKRDAK
jgi:hypothetical protein